ncbi:MAG: lipid A export permease/ATP-binding protein MsbA [Gammaproteobacteria bacterium]|jgi:subfamily B ATP-binding cassette protein MsbA
MSDSNDDKTGGATYRRLLKYILPYKIGFVAAVFGMVIVATTETGFAALMKPMLDGTFIEKDPTVIKYAPIVLLAIFLFRGVGGFIVRYCMDWVGRNLIRDMREIMFDQLLRLPANFYDRNSKGHLSSKLIFDVEQVAAAATGSVTILIRDTLTMIGLVSWMVYLSWQLTMFFVVLAPVVGGIVVIVSKRFRRISRKIQASMGNVSQISQQVIEANRVVKVYGAEDYERGVFRDANNYNRQQHMKLAVTGGLSVPVSQFIGAIGMAAVLFFATKEPMLSQISPGTFVSFISAIMLLMPAMRRLTQVTETIQRGIAAAQSIFALLDTETEKDTGTKTLDHVKGKVEFQNVSFQYASSESLILDDVSLSVEPGQTIAIVGRSGSGKSTLVSLLPRFYNVSTGEILIDGIPIHDLRLANLRKNLALVSQDITLFNDTIGNNIAYGCKELVSQEQIIQAATAAHAMEFIKDLPKGMDTVIGDRGVLISGGQRQRIAIARALLKDSPILILDEATSALDTESERIIQDALEKLMVGRTTLVIAHRLSTIEGADKIIVMHEGKIIEQGNHTDLLARGGHYAALYNMQFNEPNSTDDTDNADNTDFSAIVSTAND